MSALEGVRVIDFGQYVAGPLTGMLLADQGADVIKIDSPSGPRFDTPANACWNRGKHSIALDLKDPQDNEIAVRLVKSADVVIENFRPGVMARLGLAPEAMCSAHPGLIYCSIPGFGADDPRSSMPAWEGVVAATCGLYRDSNEATGPFGSAVVGKPLEVERGTGAAPTYTPIPVASCTAAFLASATIGMSLCAREVDGIGERIEISLFDAMYGVFSLLGMKVHGAGAHPFYLTPWIRPYLTADDRWLMLQVNYTRDIGRFLDGLGLEAWRGRGFAERVAVQQEPETARALLDELTKLMKTRSAEEWQDELSRLGLCASACYTSREWLTHEHAEASGMVLDLDDPTYGSMRQPGIQLQMSETPGRVRAPAARLDADRAAVLDTLPRRSDPSPSVARERATRSVLEGVKVLDLTIVLAGPTCGRVLAEFGADVIKIDEAGREGGDSYHLDVNRGKRSILLDLKSSEGMETFWQLAEQADVVIEGFRHGVVERLGLGYEDVRRRVPDIVYASINCYGERGPWSDRPGFEQLAQAATGMQERFGGGVPQLHSVPLNDYGTGYAAAYAVALALYHRRRTGRGQHVHTALARTAVTFQSLYVHDFKGKSWAGVPRGLAARGDGPGHRLYEASDGWFFLGADAGCFRQMCRLPDFEEVRGLEGESLERALEHRFRSESISEWTRRLASVDVGLHALQSIEQAMNDPAALAHGVSITQEHEGIGLVRTNGPSTRMCVNRPAIPGRPASVQGSETAEILQSLWD